VTGLFLVDLVYSVFFIFFCKPVDVVEEISSGPAVLIEVSAKSEWVVMLKFNF